jgi:hypothetical protein
MVKLLERGVKLSGTIVWILVAILAAATAITWLAARDAITFVAPIIMYTLAGCAILAAVISYCHVYDRTFNLDWDPLGRT